MQNFIISKFLSFIIDMKVTDISNISRKFSYIATLKFLKLFPNSALQFYNYTRGTRKKYDFKKTTILQNEETFESDQAMELDTIVEEKIRKKGRAITIKKNQGR